jgi:hypothetical protein
VESTETKAMASRPSQPDAGYNYVGRAKRTMRKAVVVVGIHHAGKSKTINNYLKPKLRIGKRQHKFWLSGKKGVVLSQSREEASMQRGFALSQSLEESGNCKEVVKIVRKYSHYFLLVLAARPGDEPHSCLNRLKSNLKSAGYAVNVVEVIKGQPEQYYRESAGKILSHLAE